jgi:SAM-dependent methyltransferase
MEASEQFVRTYYMDDLAERDSKESQWALQWHLHVRGSSVLDLGCGPQLYDDILSFGDVPREVVGIDVNTANIQFLQKSRQSHLIEARQAVRRLGTKVEIRQGDIREDNPDLRHRFQTVFASGVIGKFTESDARGIILLLTSYLTDSGRIVIVDWTDDRLTEEKFRERFDFDWYSRNGISHTHLRRLLEEGGFKVVKRGTYSVPDPERYEWGIIRAVVAKKTP